MTKILVIGATGQIGSEITPALRAHFGDNCVVALGHKSKPSKEVKDGGPYEVADATNKEELQRVVGKHDISTIYHLASILSAKGEDDPQKTWKVNMTSLKNVLDIAVEKNMQKVFWPSSIAVFGDTTPKKNTPQQTILEPTTMYGVTKLAGEALCHYYHQKFDVDVRSVRYPGIISHKTLPGGGTTDYATAMFVEGLKTGSYTCFVSPETILPMMYMEDAVNAALTLMNADPDKLSIRTSYNVAAMSFTAKELEQEITKHIPQLKVEYTPDARQGIADSWPHSIDDAPARKDWGWKPAFTLPLMTEAMIEELRKK